MDIVNTEALVGLIDARIAEALKAQAGAPHRLTLAQVCEMLGCKKQRVYDLVSQGRLRRLGPKRTTPYFDPADVRAFMDGES
jgi:excisionase family DNA binding protein